jgi:hypothetical protein
LVRRLVVLLVLSFVGAAAFGLSNASSGVNVNGANLPASTLRSEFAAIAATPTVQCYFSYLEQVGITAGAGGGSLAAAGAAAWSNLRVEGIAIDQFVRAKFHYTPDAAALTSATSSLEGDLTQAAASHCTGTAAAALEAMPSEMRTAEITAQASSLYLLSQINSTIPLNLASMRTYFNAHRSSYDTICVSVALVPGALVATFSAAQTKGLSVAALAKRFSVDPSGRKGGAYGCYGPTSTSFASVRSDVATTALNTFPTTPLSVSQNGTTYALYVAPTKRSTTSFTIASSAVLTDMRNLNASSANTIKQTILNQAAVSIDPAYGRWGVASAGPNVFAPTLPSTNDVAASSPLTTVSAHPYK